MNTLVIFAVAFASAYAGMRLAQHNETQRRIRRRLQSVVARAH